jgi:hypothetical protein
MRIVRKHIRDASVIIEDVNQLDAAGDLDYLFQDFEFALERRKKSLLSHDLALHPLDAVDTFLLVLGVM